MNSIYLDSNATTPMDDDVVTAMVDCLRQKWVNPASQHHQGQHARRVLESHREQIAAELGLGTKDHLVFTSGGTEANNLAAMSYFDDGTGQPATGVNLVSSSIEHPSLIASIEQLRQRGVEIRWVHPNRDGVVKAADFDNAIDEQTRWACCMHGNNETGVIQPINEIASICNERDLPFHVDAVQSIGKIPFDFGELNLATATLSAHKFHGPTGIGALCIRADQTIRPLFWGGHQQQGIRPGTESLPLIVGMASAFSKAKAALSENQRYVSGLRDQLEQGLLDMADKAIVHGRATQRLPHSTNLSFPGIDRQQMVLAADFQRMSISTGSACSSGSSQPSHVLTAMGCSEEEIESAVRFGVSSLNTVAEIDEAIHRFGEILTNFQKAK